jgi:Superinfection immunity protein
VQNAAVIYQSSSHGAPKDFGLGLFLGLLFAVGAFIYMLPTYIALRQENPMVVMIGLANFFFAETVLGWFIVMMWVLNYYRPVVRELTYVERLAAEKEAEKAMEAEVAAMAEWNTRHQA